MNRYSVVGLVASAVVLVTASYQLLSAQQPAVVAKDIYGQPLKLRDLTDLGPILDNKTGLSNTQITEILVHWLVQERKQPTPTFTGLSGAPIDSHYIQKQIVWTLGLSGDPQALTWLHEQAIDPSLRDALSISLAIMGDSSRASDMRRELHSDPNPYLRDLATLAMVKIGDTEGRPALTKALKDPAVIRFKAIHAPPVERRGTQEQTFYIVREAARKALDLLDKPQVIENASQRVSGFKDKTKDNESFISANRESLDLILKRAIAK